MVTISSLNTKLTLNTEGFRRGMDGSRTRVEEFRRSVVRADKQLQSFGRLPALALRGVAAFGALELGVKGVDAISEAMNGNFEKSADLVKQLPAGIGPFASALEGVLGKVTGITAEIQRLNEAIAAQNAKIEQQKKQVAAFKDLESFSMSIQQQIDLESFDTSEAREAFRLNLERLEAMRKIEDLAKKTGGVGGEKNVAAMMAKVNELYNLRTKKIGETAKASDTLSEKSKGLSQLDYALAAVDNELQSIGKDPIEIRLAGLERLGAGVDQLEAARMKLEKIESARQRIEREQAAADRQSSITGMIDDLESQVRTFGLSFRDKTMLDLEALGAGDEQIGRAVAALDKLDRLNLDKELSQASRTFEFRRVSSAEAQASAYSAGRGGDRQIDETKTQTGLQRQMLTELQEANKQRLSGGSVVLEEVDIA